MTRFLFALICLLGTSASAEMITYRFDGLKDSDGVLGPEGSPVVGFFSYDTGLQKIFDFPKQATYASPSPYTHADLHFQIHYQNHSLYTTTRPRLSMLNDYGIDPNSPPDIAFDMFMLSSTYMISPTIGFPSGINVQVMLRDSDFSIFDSTDLPTELPPIDVFESAIISPDVGITATITSLTRINNGDLDGDGFVGITDLNIVLSNWNQTVTFGDRLSGDPSGDGFVGIEDLNLVLGNWNAGTPPTDISTAPEPAGLFLLAMAALAARRI